MAGRRWVQDVPETIQVNIWVGSDGVNYALHPVTEARIKERFPNARPLPNIMLGFDKEKEFPARHKLLWERMVMMLTDLTVEEIAELGGFCIYETATKKLVWRWKTARTRSTA